MWRCGNALAGLDRPSRRAGVEWGMDVTAPLRTAEVLAIGTELLLGEIHDTNGAHLAAALAARGVDVSWTGRVGDDRARIREALAAALDRSELVVCCGGLGPTEDDLTREAIADLLGETPQVDPGLERTLRAHFEARGRVMPERNLKQAWLVPSAQSLPNSAGTAPGWLVRTRWNGARRLVAALPGPPHELHAMVERELFPRLPLPADRLFVRTFKTVGLGESAVADRLDALALSRDPSVATYAKRDGVHVRVAARGADAASARARAERTVAEVAERLAGHVWGADADTLPGVIVARLHAAAASLAIAEDASGGRLADALTAPHDARKAVRGAVLAWSPEAMATLGVPAGPHESASTQAERVAAAARASFAADVAIAVGELRTRKDGESVATRVAIAVNDARGTAHAEVRLPAGTDADTTRDRLVTEALALLWRRLDHD